MSRMPSGQYIPGDSLLHRLDARVKIAGFVLLIAAVVAASSAEGYAFLFLAVAAMIRLSGLHIRHALGSIARLWLFFVVIFTMNALFFHGGQPVAAWGIFRISAQGLRQGINVVLNVALIMVLANLLTCTTAPMDTTGAVAGLLKPLKLIRVPVEDVAMIVGAAIQLVPTLIEEADTIKKAQTARGARFESKKLMERAASFLPLIVPIFIGAFRRADELATAMEARGYRNARSRTPKRRAALSRADVTALTCCIAMCLFQLYVFG